mmetsp:Transcript_9653/g.18119  ORF Transcript_9653/g.18119 Transcript_9653/m.18119 type:complete len:146 (-) Transcript_9653:74-511(-)
MSTNASSSSQPVLQSRRSLYVGGIANEVTEVTLRATMIPFGPIKSIEIPMDYALGKHKGFAFVEYNDAEDASEAIYNLDGSELYGRVLTVNLAQRDRLHINSNKAVWSTDDFFQASSKENSNELNNQEGEVVEKTLTEEGVSRQR